jgi:phage/plasmid-like protein (TIGR03299 family)
MAHDIEQMFSVRAMPWHKSETGDRTTVTEDYPQTFAEARKLAGLDWDPVAVPAVERVMTAAQYREEVAALINEDDRDGSMSASELAGAITDLYERSLRTDKEFRRIARSDNLAATLSYQRDSYNLIPNSAFGEIIESILQAEPDTVKLETGGSLGGGRRVWMLARIDEPVKLPGDGSMTFPFLGLTSSHDGHASCAARLTTVRIVCGNTFSAAEAEGDRTGAVYSFSHRGDWRSRMGEAREALIYARTQTQEYVAAMTELLGVKVTPQQEDLFLLEFIPEPPDGLISDRVATNIIEARLAVRGFLSGPTIEGSGVRGTAYGLVQAAGEYLDHVRAARSWESRMNRSLLKPEPLKAKAAQLARLVSAS